MSRSRFWEERDKELSLGLGFERWSPPAVISMFFLKEAPVMQCTCFYQKGL